MSKIAIAGAGAFGTGLAIAFARAGNDVTLWARSPKAAADMQKMRENERYLAGLRFPDTLKPSSDIHDLDDADAILLAIPTQNLRAFLNDHSDAIAQHSLVVCCKGIEKTTGKLPTQVVQDILPNAEVSVLTGPGFASEIAEGKPTALTLAMPDDRVAAKLQALLRTPNLRLYRTKDVVGAQLGGALKNVIAIACGIAIGAQLGESARAALLTRGYAEISRLAIRMGASSETLAGLSGLGDLALTCTSKQSRNFMLGLNLGRGGRLKSDQTVEGVATANATVALAERLEVEMPISKVVSAVLNNKITIKNAMDALLSRPQKQES